MVATIQGEAVELSAVNRVATGSNPVHGAIFFSL